MVSSEGLLFAFVVFVLAGVALVALVVLSVAGARRAKDAELRRDDDGDREGVAKGV